MPIYKLTNPRWDEDSIIVGCDCGNNEHQIVISLWPECDEPQEFYIAPHLRMYKGFFKRVVAAVRYIFGHKSKYGHYGEFVLTPEDVKEMFKFFDKHIDGLVENRDRWNKPL
jgi:hypothetical protein